MFNGLVLAVESVSVRSIKAIKTEVIIFYYCLFGFAISAVYIFAEMLLIGNKTRLSSYTGRQYGFCILTAIFDTGSNIFVTLAYQMDRSSFVCMVSYVSIVYAFTCDTFIFHNELNTVELCCVVWILFVTLGIAFYKLHKQKLEQESKLHTE